MSGASPFVHRFRSSDGQAYVYDVNTAQILRVNDAVFDALGLVDTRDDESVLSALQHHHSRAAAYEALQSIRQSQLEHGVFSTERPRAVRYWQTKDTLRRRMQGEIGQLILEVTENCNLRCSYCPFTDLQGVRRNHSPRPMELSVAEKAIDYLISHSIDRQSVTLSFYGGEPLLSFDLIKQCVEYIERTVGDSKEVSFMMTTNATVLSRKVAAFLAEKRVRFSVSLDGPAALHDRYRTYANGRGSFDIIARNLRRLREMYPEYYESCVSFNLVLTPPYDLNQVVEFIQSGDIISPNQGIRTTYASGRDTNFYSRFTEDVKAGCQDAAGEPPLWASRGMRGLV